MEKDNKNIERKFYSIQLEKDLDHETRRALREFRPGNFFKYNSDRKNLTVSLDCDVFDLYSILTKHGYSIKSKILEQ